MWNSGRVGTDLMQDHSTNQAQSHVIWLRLHYSVTSNSSQTLPLTDITHKHRTNKLTGPSGQ